MYFLCSQSHTSNFMCSLDFVYREKGMREAFFVRWEENRHLFCGKESEEGYAQAIKWAETTTNVFYLTELGKHRNEYVRACAARNQMATQGMLTSLARDDSELVRGMVAMFTTNPDDLMLIGGANPGAKVAEALAGNPKTPSETLESVVKSYCENGNVDDVSKQACNPILDSVLLNPSTPLSVLVQFVATHEYALDRFLKESPDKVAAQSVIKLEQEKNKQLNLGWYLFNLQERLLSDDPKVVRGALTDFYAAHLGDGSPSNY